MNFDLRNLQLFVRVAELGAIGKAGAEFTLSSTNASQRIQALEADLDVKLLNRTTRSVSLTPDGEVFLEHSRRILDDVEEARTVLSYKAKSVSGRLRVTASASFGRSHIVPYVPEFLRDHPDLTLDLNLTDAVVDIVHQGYDLAFRIGDLAPSSLLAQKIDDNPSVLVASPDYLAQSGRLLAPDDLKDHACIPLGDVRTWRLVSADEAIHDIGITGPVSVNLGNAVSEWVKAGVGIGHASLWHCGADLKSGALVRVLSDFQIFQDSKIWAVRPPGRLMHARVKAFLDFMRVKIVETNKAEYGYLLNS